MLTSLPSASWSSGGLLHDTASLKDLDRLDLVVTDDVTAGAIKMAVLVGVNEAGEEEGMAGL